MTPEPEPMTFSCTPGGGIALGIRRLSRFFSALVALMVLAAAACWITGRLFPGFLALAVASLVAFTWRMSNDLRPRQLMLERGLLMIATPRQLIEFSIEGATIRPLEDDERAHLERLASAGGVVAGSGGFDSRHLGEFDLYASDFANALYIRGLEVKLVVTPDQPAEFIRTFRQMTDSPLLQSSAHE